MVEATHGECSQCKGKVYILKSFMAGVPVLVRRVCSECGRVGALAELKGKEESNGSQKLAL